jgi:serine/threonine protein kinase
MTMTLSPGARLGPYEILAAIGAGGMGEVYRARDTRLDRTVAIKVLPAHVSADPDRQARFAREAKTIAGLNHPHICTLHDIGEHEGTTYLVMEHLTGETLAERLEKGPLPLEQALTVATEIAEALAAAHRQGVVHRDLKPGNVMLTKGGATLLDFGLARLTAHGEQPAAASLASAPTRTAPLTSEGQIVGTLQYMAPEQIEGKPADARTDLWALGAILYEMLTGKRAFEGTSAASLIGRIMTSEPPALAALQPLTPPALDRFVRRCLAKSPDDRWQSAHDVALFLDSLDDLVTESTRARPRRKPWNVAAVVATVRSQPPNTREPARAWPSRATADAWSTSQYGTVRACSSSARSIAPRRRCCAERREGSGRSFRRTETGWRSSPSRS